MAPDVLESIQIGVGTLGHLPQHKPAVAFAQGEMAALAVGSSAAGHFHQKRRAGCSEMIEQGRIERSPEIVRVRDKGITDPLPQQAVQPTAADERRIQIAMTGRAPFQRWICGPTDRSECFGIDLGDLVLHQLELRGIAQARRSGSFRLRQMLQCLMTGAEAVHQQQAHVRAAELAQIEDLTQHKIEEIHALADRQEALGPLQAHAGAQAAIEFDDNRLV